MSSAMTLGRAQILAFKRRVGALDERLPRGARSLRQAAWAGLQDSMPRAALLSIRARMDGTTPSIVEDPSLVQLWGPRFSAYVVPTRDVAPFTLGRLPNDADRRRKAQDLATRLDRFLDGREMPYGEAGRGLGVHPNMLRYAAPTGRVLIRWDGARQPTIRSVPAPDVDPGDARLELARRYVHVFGPATAAGFARWAGIKPAAGQATFDGLPPSLAPVRTPVGDAWILARDEAAFRAPAEPGAPARLLPSGDAYTLLQGADRELLVPEPDLRRRLWTPRVWPGALLVRGEIVGTWRRAGAAITVEPWRRLARAEREDVEAEAAGLPLPGIEGRITLRWDG